MVAVGERRNYQYQTPNSRRVAALDFVHPQAQVHHGNNADEQRVPQVGWPDKSEAMNKNWPYDYASNESYYGYPTNNMQYAYPLLQPDMPMMNFGQVQEQEGGNKAPARQNSIPPGTEYLDQYLHSDIDYYNIDYDNFGALGGYDNDGFSVEDYIDLDKVDVCEQDGINFDVAVKQEKTGSDELKNLEEMEHILNANIQNPNSDWAQNIESYSVPQVNTGNEPNFTELNNNFGEIFSNSVYNPNNGDWQSHYQTLSAVHPTTVSGELVIKTEQDNLSDCSHTIQHESRSGLTIPDDELVEMPVSRFNELLTTLTAEQCCEAKDIRRRGKNKKAARLCRKRKLENISQLENGKSHLEQSINRLNDENRALFLETEELKRNIETICKMLINGLNNSNDPGAGSAQHLDMQ